MNTTSLPSKLFLSLGLALGSLSLVVPTAAVADERTVGEAIDDASITASIKTKLIEDQLTEGFDINVTTKNGVVSLKGGADSQAAKDAATRIAQSTKGVTRVDNQIVVAPEGSVARTEAIASHGYDASLRLNLPPLGFLLLKPPVQPSAESVSTPRRSPASPKGEERE